jgi:hypothetical protein
MSGTSLLAVNSPQPDKWSPYTPINYNDKDFFSRPATELRLASLPKALELYNDFYDLQDKRRDPSHVNTVIHFTLEIAKL